MFPGYFEQFEKWNRRYAANGGGRNLQRDTHTRSYGSADEKFQKQVALAADGAPRELCLRLSILER